MKAQWHFASEAPAASLTPGFWTMLIVDDEPEMHAVTTLALEEFSFAGRKLRFLHAESGAQARRLLQQHDDIAIVLLDVVMESERAGLDVVDYVRNVLKNKFVRVILRTGQPGQAPELEVITRYDINDYKHKTELTRDRLYTTVYTALSTYRDLRALDANRRGLEQVIEASASLFELDSIERFAQGVLEQLIALLFLDWDAVMLQPSGMAAAGATEQLKIVAGTGVYRDLVGREAGEALSGPVMERIKSARAEPGPVYGADYFIGHDTGEPGGEWFYYVTAPVAIGEPDRRLIELFCRNVALARSHVLLRRLERRP